MTELENILNKKLMGKEETPESAPSIISENGVSSEDVQAEILPLPQEEKEEKESGPTKEALIKQIQILKAEFDNYRNRMVKERSEWFVILKERVIADLLPALDSFEKAFEENGDVTPDVKKFLDGFNLIYKQLKNSLLNHGLVKMDSKGKNFDPNIHEALQVIENNKLKKGVEKVAQVIQEGYLLEKRVIRPAKVVVEKRPEKDN